MTKQRLTIVVAALAAASSLFATACSENNSTGISPTSRPSAPGVNVLGLHGVGVVLAGAYDGDSTATPAGAMSEHSGSVLWHTNTYAIFVGSAWNTDPTFTGDKITSIQSFFQGFGGSYYANTVTEYRGTGNQSTLAGTFVDNGTPPNGSPYATSVGTYVCNFLAPHGLSPDWYAVYTVYSTDPPYDIGGGYVALGWHGATSCGGVTIHFAMVFNMDGWGLVTDTQHYHSDNAAELANTTAHELAEIITDASPGNGWYAQNTGGEIGDKCNFTFGPSPYVTLTNGSVFKLQGEWSNQAYQDGTGFPNINNEHGCVNKVLPPPQITGTSSMSSADMCYFYASESGGTAPFQYTWSYYLRDGASAVGYSPNNGTFFLAAENNWGHVYITVKATDANGVQGPSVTKVITFGSGSCYSS
jgi:hypothetical protein